MRRSLFPPYPSRRRITAGAIILFAIVVSSCAMKRLAPAAPYRFTRSGDVDLLTPPGGHDDTTSPGLAVYLPNARETGTPTRQCDIQEYPLTLRWSGSAAEVRLSSHMLNAGSRIPVDLLDGINRFRWSLNKLETNSCLASGEASKLIDRILETQPMPSVLSFYLRYGAPASAGFVELQPPLSLKVVTPVKSDYSLPHGVSVPVVGYRVTRYSVDPRPAASGYWLRVLCSETVIDGNPTPNHGAPTVDIQIPASARFFRLVLTQRLSSDDHDSALLSAPRHDKLDDATHIFKVGYQPSCQSLPNTVGCMVFSNNVAASVELPVSVNGQIRYVYLGATLRDAILAAGESEPEHVLQRLRVYRPFENSARPIAFDRCKPDILGLVLIGGEQIDW